MKTNRRQLLQGAAALWAATTAGLTVSTRAAHAARGERKFLFFFAGGGWDATPLDPKFGEDGISPIDGTDMDPDTWRAEIGNLSWSGGDDRPAMDRFFTRWGNQAALVRGVNVHSAGHESGRQWAMTGTSSSNYPDWPTTLAAFGSGDYPMPHLVFSGPAYPGNQGAALVRGGGGTLLDLIDGSIVTQPDVRTDPFATPADSMMDALVYGRAAQFAASREGLGASRAEDLLGSLERSMELEGRRFEAGLGDTGSTMLDQAIMACEVMRLGLSRCAMVSIPGGWDTHGGNQNVGPQMDNFFDGLHELFEHLASTPGRDAPWLIDEVVVVAASELGRTPRFNGSMGRDHWPYTSMMVAGSGVRGNRVFGQTDDGFIALPVDFETGQRSDSGDIIGTENVGTALLQLGGLDPENHLPGIQPLTGLLR
ncbi:MAG: DUF1501 domain-containing protein [Alphaproteobacteria bacterium]|nr:DUF1501 domain-containing protein [Alphaproteobacteria bacterium]MCB9759599.1 DUF1501 domain-containing protein [Alphaproteobacteria bacterium]